MFGIMIKIFASMTNQLLAEAALAAYPMRLEKDEAAIENIFEVKQYE